MPAFKDIDTPRLDGHSEAAYLVSYQALVAPLNDEERRQLLISIYKLEASAREASSPQNAEDFFEISRRCVDGMSFAEIVARADALTTDRERHEAAIEAKAKNSYESLSEPERVWYTITRLLFCIRNGGLPSYFYNGYSQHVADCMRSLEILGAPEMVAMVRKMNGLDWDRPPGAKAVLTGLFLKWMGVEARESERELDQASVVETKLNEYMDKKRIA